jgi:hypothetical protein
MDRNEKNREAAERRKMAREKKYEQQKEAELSARKRRDAAYAELRASNEAEEKAKKVRSEGNSIELEIESPSPEPRGLHAATPNLLSPLTHGTHHLYATVLLNACARALSSK